MIEKTLKAKGISLAHQVSILFGDADFANQDGLMLLNSTLLLLLIASRPTSTTRPWTSQSGSYSIDKHPWSCHRQPSHDPPHRVHKRLYLPVMKALTLSLCLKVGGYPEKLGLLLWIKILGKLCSSKYPWVNDLGVRFSFRFCLATPMLTNRMASPYWLLGSVRSEQAPSAWCYKQSRIRMFVE